MSGLRMCKTECTCATASPFLLLAYVPEGKHKRRNMSRKFKALKFISSNYVI